VPAETADYYNDYDKKKMIYKHIYRNAASLLVDALTACPAVIKFTKPSTIVTHASTPIICRILFFYYCFCRLSHSAAIINIPDKCKKKHIISLTFTP
jgi:ABC-type microcin C transport system permease subunit YejB